MSALSGRVRLILGSGLATLLALAGCADTAYYWQSVSGHVQLMHAARPIDDWLADPETSDTLKQRLHLAREIRSFAVTQLHLPDNASYHRYADLQRPAAVWNVVAAPAYSLTSKTWCFVVAGCVGYRGYFSQAQAQQQAQQLRGEGWEVSVYGVPAYSTLGWMNWLGGDPLLNTFVTYPDAEVARMLFHELSHQVLYVNGDTGFNESFATAVERLGAQTWLAQQASPKARSDYEMFDARRQQFRALTRATRARLQKIYEAHPEQPQNLQEMAAQKQDAMQEFRQNYGALKASWGGYRGYDNWVEQANNASFAAQAAYDEWVPGFEALFVLSGRNWSNFYDAVRQLAKQDKAQRAAQLKQWASQFSG
jgi:predicted aminopeptidase